MNIFLDTANIEEIKKAKRWGVLKGLTTNPSIVAREGKDFVKLAKELCDLVHPYPVSLEVVDRTGEGMAEQARTISDLGRNVVVKLPTNPEGLAALNLLKGENIKTNLTLVFSTSQALLAMSSGATYVSPFIGRLEDRGYEGIGLVRDIMHIHNAYKFKTEIIAASIRDPHQVIEAAKTGAHIITMPFAVLEKMLLNTMTDTDLEKFLSDWEKVPGRGEAFSRRGVENVG